MDMMSQALTLFVKFATIGGGLWTVWGVITLAGGLRDHQGPQIQSGVWQAVGGCCAAFLEYRAVALKNNGA